MATIKKAYQPILSILAANMGAKVKDVYEQIEALASAKAGGGGGATSFNKDENGVVNAVRCFYHGLWMSPQVTEFGAKASSASGLNSMCKAGVSKWTKQQATFKKAKEELLDRVSAGEVEPGDIQAEIEMLEEAKNAVVPLEDGYGFDSLEACLEDLATR